MKKVLLFLPLLVMVITAAIPPQHTSVAPVDNAKKVVVDYKDAKAALETVKGDKLSLKEKAALKIATNKANKGNFASGEKNQIIALLLCFFLGGLGIHRFYLGYTTVGIIQLLTLGGCGIWALIDFVRIIIGDLGPKDGDYDKTF